MSPIAITIIGLLITFLGTILGSAVIFLFKKDQKIPEKLNEIILGFASGIMLSASIFSLIIPAIENESAIMPSYLVCAISIGLGALFLFAIDKIVPHFHKGSGKEEGVHTVSLSRTSKMLLAVTIHNIPEGLAVGISFGITLGQGGDNAAILSSLMLAVGIAIQNIPEGLGVSLPLFSEGNSKSKSFLLGSLSSAVEPIAALFGFFLAYNIQSLMPWALCFAAGCMIYVIVEEMVPEVCKDSTKHHGVLSFFIGFLLMMILDSALG